jgi:hypothetical protein
MLQAITRDVVGARRKQASGQPANNQIFCGLKLITRRPMLS